MAVPGKKAEGVDSNRNEHSEDISTIFCQPCDENGQQLPAVGFCMDCEDNLCDACFTHHCRARPFRHHVLQDRTIMPRNLDQRKASDMTGNVCDEHQREIITFYCGSHDCFGCAICIDVDHRSCEGIKYVKKEYEELSTTLSNLKEQIVSNERNIKDNVECIEQHYSDAIVRIGQFRKELNGLLDKLEHEMNNKAKTIKDEDQAAMSSISTKMNDMKSEINSSIAEINTLHNLQKHRKLFAIIDKTKENINILDNTLTQMQNENTIRRYVFEPEKQLNDLFDNLKSIESLSVMNQSHDNTGTPSTTAGECKPSQTRNLHLHHHHQQQQQQQKEQQQKTGTSQTDIYYDKKLTQTEYAVGSKVKQTGYEIDKIDIKVTETKASQYAKHDKLREVAHVSDINVKSSNDEKCTSAKSVVLLPNNQLIIVDYENSNVKLVNMTQNTITSEIRLPSEPWDLTMIDNNNVAVTVPDLCEIRLLTVVSQSLSADRDIKANGQCLGIVYKDETLIVTFTDPKVKVEIINMSGDVLKSLVNNAVGAQLFSRPKYIAFNQDKTAVYVSDYDEHSVTCMTLDGTVKGVCRDDNLKYPSGLTIDRTGTVYVCGFLSNTIHQITADCTKLQTLLKQQNGIYWPQSITYCDREDKLYVGMWNNNVVKTLQLK